MKWMSVLVTVANTFISWASGGDFTWWQTFSSPCYSTHWRNCKRCLFTRLEATRSHVGMSFLDTKCFLNTNANIDQSIRLGLYYIALANKSHDKDHKIDGISTLALLVATNLHQWFHQAQDGVTPLVLRARLAPRLRPKRNQSTKFLGFENLIRT